MGLLLPFGHPGWTAQADIRSEFAPTQSARQNFNPASPVEYVAVEFTTDAQAAVADCTEAMPCEPSPAEKQQQMSAFLPLLPEGLSAEQRTVVLRILDKAGPRLFGLHLALMRTMHELRELSFAPDSPRDQLLHLGQKLIAERDALRRELQTINQRIVQETGVDPGWGQARGCNTWNLDAKGP